MALRRFLSVDSVVCGALVLLMFKKLLRRHLNACGYSVLYRTEVRDAVMEYCAKRGRVLKPGSIVVHVGDASYQKYEDFKVVA